MSQYKSSCTQTNTRLKMMIKLIKQPSKRHTLFFFSILFLTFLDNAQCIGADYYCQSSSSHCILLGPGSGSALVLDSVCLVGVSYFWNQRIIRVWICQQWAYRKKDLWKSQHQPLLTLKHMQIEESISLSTKISSSKSPMHDYKMEIGCHVINILIIKALTISNS